MLLLPKHNTTLLYSSHKTQQSKLTKLLLLTNGRLVPCPLFCFLLLPCALWELWRLNSRQLRKLTPAAFAFLTSSHGSKKFLIRSRAGARREGHKVMSRGN